MPDFPRITLRNLNSLVDEHGCLPLNEREESLRIANEINFTTAMLSSKVAAWVDGIRRDTDGQD
jgi:hypothetical protein